MSETKIPYQKDQATVQFAGFWWRFLAYVIDEIIVSFVSWIFIIPILAIFGISMFSLKQAGYDMESNALLLAPVAGAILSMISVSLAAQWLYFALMESSRYQGTLGKLLLKIKVTDYKGGRISFARATGRYFGKILSGMFFMIGYIIAGLTEKKQALHDFLASCYVIKE